MKQYVLFLNPEIAQSRPTIKLPLSLQAKILRPKMEKPSQLTRKENANFRTSKKKMKRSGF